MRGLASACRLGSLRGRGGGTRHIVVCALALAVAWPAAPAHSRDVLRLKPSTRWNLHYADDSCRLGRRFGEGPQQVTLVLDQFEPGDSFEVRLIGKSLKPRRDHPSLQGTLRFGPNEPEAEITGLMGTLGQDPVLIIESDQRLAPLTEAQKAASAEADRKGLQFILEPIGQAREAAATWFELRKALRSDLFLETGPMDKPLAALRKCSWDTVASWGLNIDQQKSLTRHPVANTNSSSWITYRDYPQEMIRGGYQGIVHYRLIVDEKGQATSCHIQLSTRPKEFDDAVCRAVMKRARFHPALDANGKPAPGYWVQTVRFKIE